jgi:hypothetical protein
MQPVRRHGRPQAIAAQPLEPDPIPQRHDNARVPSANPLRSASSRGTSVPDPDVGILRNAAELSQANRPETVVAGFPE